MLPVWRTRYAVALILGHTHPATDSDTRQAKTGLTVNTGKRIVADMSKNEAASALGKLAKGVKKTLTKKERVRRKKSLEVARVKRWPGKKNEAGTICQ